MLVVYLPLNRSRPPSVSTIMVISFLCSHYKSVFVLKVVPKHRLKVTQMSVDVEIEYIPLQVER